MNITQNLRFEFIAVDSEKIQQVHAIRNKVFVEEQAVSKDIEYDENESQGIHYLLYKNDIAVATGRWRETEKGIKLERFAVLKEYRNLGLGSILLNNIMKKVKDKGKRIYLHSQLPACTYYERSGFQKKGEPFYEANIKHYLMEYKGF